MTREQMNYASTRCLLTIVRGSKPQLEHYTAAKAELLRRRDAVRPVVVEDDCAPPCMRYYATDGDYDLDTAVGRGATAEEAVADLYWMLDLSPEDLDEIPDLIACERCNGSGEVAHWCSRAATPVLGRCLSMPPACAVIDARTATAPASSKTAHRNHPIIIA
jgi:hypothetical protein